MGSTKLVTDQLKDLCVTESKINAGAVTVTKIGTGAVTGVKIANTTILGTKLIAGTLTNTQINSAAGIVESKLALTRGTNTLVQGSTTAGVAVLPKMIWGEAIILSGSVTIAVAFGSAFFSNTSYRVSICRTTTVPKDIYADYVVDTWVDTKTVNGFVIHLAIPENTNAVYDYMAIGT